MSADGQSSQVDDHAIDPLGATGITEAAQAVVRASAYTPGVHQSPGSHEAQRLPLQRELQLNSSNANAATTNSRQTPGDGSAGPSSQDTSPPPTALQREMETAKQRDLEWMLETKRGDGAVKNKLKSLAGTDDEERAESIADAFAARTQLYERRSLNASLPEKRYDPWQECRWDENYMESVFLDYKEDGQGRLLTAQSMPHEDEEDFSVISESECESSLNLEYSFMADAPSTRKAQVCFDDLVRAYTGVARLVWALKTLEEETKYLGGKRAYRLTAANLITGELLQVPVLRMVKELRDHNLWQDAARSYVTCAWQRMTFVLRGVLSTHFAFIVNMLEGGPAVPDQPVEYEEVKQQLTARHERASDEISRYLERIMDAQKRLTDPDLEEERPSVSAPERPSVPMPLEVSVASAARSGDREDQLLRIRALEDELSWKQSVLETTSTGADADSLRRHVRDAKEQLEVARHTLKVLEVLHESTYRPAIKRERAQSLPVVRDPAPQPELDLYTDRGDNCETPAQKRDRQLMQLSVKMLDEDFVAKLQNLNIQCDETPGDYRKARLENLKSLAEKSSVWQEESTCRSTIEYADWFDAKIMNPSTLRGAGQPPSSEFTEWRQSMAWMYEPPEAPLSVEEETAMEELKALRRTASQETLCALIDFVRAIRDNVEISNDKMSSLFLEWRPKMQIEKFFALVYKTQYFYPEMESALVALFDNLRGMYKDDPKLPDLEVVLKGLPVVLCQRRYVNMNCRGLELTDKLKRLVNNLPPVVLPPVVTDVLRAYAQPEPSAGKTMRYVVHDDGRRTTSNLEPISTAVLLKNIRLETLRGLLLEVTNDTPWKPYDVVRLEWEMGVYNYGYRPDPSEPQVHPDFQIPARHDAHLQNNFDRKYQKTTMTNYKYLGEAFIAQKSGYARIEIHMSASIEHTALCPGLVYVSSRVAMPTRNGHSVQAKIRHNVFAKDDTVVFLEPHDYGDDEPRILSFYAESEFKVAGRVARQVVYDGRFYVPISIALGAAPLACWNSLSLLRSYLTVFLSDREMREEDADDATPEQKNTFEQVAVLLRTVCEHLRLYQKMVNACAWANDEIRRCLNAGSAPADMLRTWNVTSCSLSLRRDTEAHRGFTADASATMLKMMEGLDEPCSDWTEKHKLILRDTVEGLLRRAVYLYDQAAEVLDESRAYAVQCPEYATYKGALGLLTRCVHHLSLCKTQSESQFRKTAHDATVALAVETGAEKQAPRSQFYMAVKMDYLFNVLNALSGILLTFALSCQACKPLYHAKSYGKADGTPYLRVPYKPLSWCK